jgi:hypothetical protein
MLWERRQRMICDLLDYYECDPERLIDERIGKQFKYPEKLFLSRHWRDVVGTVVDESALLFQEPPDVEFQDDGDQDLFDELWDALNLPAHFQTIEAYSILCGSLLVGLFEDSAEETGVAINYTTPNLLVVPTDARRPTRALEYRIRRTLDRGARELSGNALLPGARQPNIQGDRRAGMDTAIRLLRPNTLFGPPPQETDSGRGLEIVYDVFTKRPGAGPVWSVVSAANAPMGEGQPLAYDPFVEFHARQPVSEWAAPAPFDLLSAQNRIVDHLVELGHQLRFNAFAIPHVSPGMTGELVMDPSRPLTRPVDDEGKEIENPLGFASPENDFTFQQLRGVIDEEVKAIREKWGLTSNQHDATSGFMLQILSMPQQRRLRRRRAVMVPALRRFVLTLMRAKGREVAPDKVTIRLVESTLPEDPAYSVQMLSKLQTEMTMGLTSLIRVLMDRDPDLDEEAAEKLANDIAAENKKFNKDPLEAMAELAGARGRMGRGLPPADDDTDDPEDGDDPPAEGDDDEE